MLMCLLSKIKTCKHLLHTAKSVSFQQKLISSRKKYVVKSQDSLCVLPSEDLLDLLKKELILDGRGDCKRDIWRK